MNLHKYILDSNNFTTCVKRELYPFYASVLLLIQNQNINSSSENIVGENNIGAPINELFSLHRYCSPKFVVAIVVTLNHVGFLNLFFCIGLIHALVHDIFTVLLHMYVVVVVIAVPTFCNSNSCGSFQQLSVIEKTKKYGKLIA